MFTDQIVSSNYKNFSFNGVECLGLASFTLLLKWMLKKAIDMAVAKGTDMA